jgi:hypothetical protein
MAKKRSPKPSPESSEPPVTSTFPHGSADPLVQWMLKLGEPVTRENYLALNFPEGVPDPLPAELEASLPWELQLPET